MPVLGSVTRNARPIDESHVGVLQVERRQENWKSLELCHVDRGNSSCLFRRSQEITLTAFTADDCAKVFRTNPGSRSDPEYVVLVDALLNLAPPNGATPQLVGIPAFSK